MFKIQQSNIIIGILDSPLSFIFSFFFTLSVVILYLDDFRLSKYPFIKYLQIISFIGIPLYLIYSCYNIYNMIDIVSYVTDNDKDVNTDVDINATVSIGKDAASELAKGMNTIGSNIGLGASVAGLGGAVAKGIANGSLPPLQKAGVIIAGGVIGGIIH